MKMVKANKPGYYRARRDTGDVFAVPDDFKAKWVDDADFGEVPEKADKEATEEEIADIAKLSDTELNLALDAEIAGKKRRGYLAKLQDEIANRADGTTSQKSDDLLD